MAHSAQTRDRAHNPFETLDWHWSAPISHPDRPWKPITTTPQDVEWFEFKRVVANGKPDMKAVGNLCLVHGLTCGAWPSLSPEEVVTKCQSSAKFAVEFAHAEKLQMQKLEEHGAPTFKAKKVYGCDRSGIRVETKLALLTAAQFAEHYNKPPERVPGVRTFNTIRDEEGSFPTFLAVPLTGLPEKYRCRTVTLFSESSTAISEEVVSPGTQLRAEQASEHFQYCLTEALKSRPDSLRLTNIPKLVLHTDIKTKVRELDEKLQQAEDQEGDDDSDTVGDAGVRSRGLTIGTGSRADSAKAAKEKKDKFKAKRLAITKGLGRGASGGSRVGAAASSRSIASASGTPNKAGMSSVLRLSQDCSGKKGDAASSSMGASVLGETSLRTVYPTLDIEGILLGGKLKRSKNGVRGLD